MADLGRKRRLEEALAAHRQLRRVGQMRVNTRLGEVRLEHGRRRTLVDHQRHWVGFGDDVDQALGEPSPVHPSSTCTPPPRRCCAPAIAHVLLTGSRSTPMVWGNGFATAGARSVSLCHRSAPMGGCSVSASVGQSPMPRRSTRKIFGVWMSAWYSSSMYSGVIR